MNEKETMKGNLKISCFDSFPFSELKPILEFISSKGYEIQFVDNGNIVCQKIEQDASSTKNAPKGCGEELKVRNDDNWLCEHDGHLCSDCMNLNKRVIENKEGCNKVISNPVQKPQR